MLDGAQIKNRTGELKYFWNLRNLKFRDWYEQIRMVDNLAQRDMESFVGNDPRASFNLIGSILKQRIPHRIPAGDLDAAQVAPAAELSKMFDRIWQEVYDTYRQRGRHWIDDLVDFMLATGWYAVFVMPMQDGSEVFSEVWNPHSVYPMWHDTLRECAHIFNPGREYINRLAIANGWTYRGKLGENSTISDYWWLEDTIFGIDTHNAIMIDNELVKPDTVEPRVDRIPIFTSPVGGLPDRGELQTRRGLDRWKQEIGQSFIATNENVYRSSNKWWTFIMQLLRDTAQPRTFEKTTQANKIVNPETWNRRGAHYKLGPQDDIGFITPPPIPVELRSTQLDMEAMMQRGGPSWAMFGAAQQRLTAYAMAQIAATTHQVSRSYHQGIMDCITDIDNFLYRVIRKNKYRPYGLSLPSGLPDRVRITADYELRVPGDLVQRATTSRMLNPEFTLSDEYIMEHNFPEIKNPAEELSRIRAGTARRNPIYSMLSLIEALRSEAVLLRNARDSTGAQLYEAAAAKLEQQLLGTPAEQAPPQMPTGASTAQPISPRPEVRPPREGGL